MILFSFHLSCNRKKTSCRTRNTTSREIDGYGSDLNAICRKSGGKVEKQDFNQCPRIRKCWELKAERSKIQKIRNVKRYLFAALHNMSDRDIRAGLCIREKGWQGSKMGLTTHRWKQSSQLHRRTSRGSKTRHNNMLRLPKQHRG